MDSTTRGLIGTSRLQNAPSLYLRPKKRIISTCRVAAV
nr:MAG TPA: hypothetical protein [Caudoviricetes sp.]